MRCVCCDGFDKFNRETFPPKKIPISLRLIFSACTFNKHLEMKGEGYSQQIYLVRGMISSDSEINGRRNHNR